jgi:hypothetical protein
MKTTAALEVRCVDDEVRRSLESTLSPDNEGGPRELRLSMKGRGRRLSFEVETDSPSTSVSTALALLRDIALFQEVWLLSRPGQG